MRKFSKYACRAAQRVDPVRGAEIGVWRGDTSVALLQTFPKLSLYMVDPWEKEVNIESMPKTEEELIAARELAFGLTDFAKDRRTVIQEISEVAVKQVDDGTLDFIFIDGNHLYEFVRKDLELWEPKVKFDGVLIGHDYDGRGDKLFNWGVKRAVDEFVESRGYEVRLEGSSVWSFIKQKTASDA